MAHESRGLGSRLIQLPGQLLLALINAMALLVIIACVLVLVVLNRVDTAGQRIAGEVTEAALGRLQVSPAEFRTRLETLDTRIEALSAKLSDPDLGDHWQLTEEIKELNGNLADIRLAAKGMRDAAPQVTEKAFDQAGKMLTDALFALRGCTPAAPSASEPTS